MFRFKANSTIYATSTTPKLTPMTHLLQQLIPQMTSNTATERIYNNLHSQFRACVDLRTLVYPRHVSSQINIKVI